MKQKDRILEYLKEHGSITPLESWRECGVYRLASRIHDLKQDGFDIEKDTATVTNSYGEQVRFARYSLKMGEEPENWHEISLDLAEVV